MLIMLRLSVEKEKALSDSKKLYLRKEVYDSERLNWHSREIGMDDPL
jgi:hypothetical protein